MKYLISVAAGLFVGYMCGGVKGYMDGRADACRDCELDASLEHEVRMMHSARSR